MENPKQNKPGLGQAVAVTAVIVAIMLVGIFAFSALINEMLPTAKSPGATPAGVVQSGAMEAAQSYQTQASQTSTAQPEAISASSDENKQSPSEQSPILFSLKPQKTAEPAEVQQHIRNGIIDLTNYWKLMRHADQTVAMISIAANGIQSALASILPGNRGGMSATPAGVQQQTDPQSAPSKTESSSPKALPPYLLISTLTELKKKRIASLRVTPAK